jgi:hypothetical protein
MGTSGVHPLVPPRSVETRQSDARRMGHTSLSEMKVHDKNLWAREAHPSPKLRSAANKPELSTTRRNQSNDIAYGVL